MKRIVLTGASGNMGRAVLEKIYSVPDTVTRILVKSEKAEKAFIGTVKKKYPSVEIVCGNLADERVCYKLVDNADYVVNCAAVIPPKSDKSPEAAIECNYYGVKTLLDAIKGSKNQPKLIHISSVALYGNRNYLHPWGRVGDPLLPSVFDVYAKSKLFGERLVLESGLNYWAVLRQTAMLHERMLADNMKDGLMFHTCFNSPLEWITAADSGLLIKNILIADMSGSVENFWKKVYNIGAGESNRNTGYETFNDGFGIIGGSAKSFMEPSWQATRNFHGMWFSDGEILQKEFNYQTEKCSDYWKEILKNHPYYGIAKIIPTEVIKTLAIKRLLSDSNSPTKWEKNSDEARMKAYFCDGKRDTRSWAEFPLLSEGNTERGKVDYENMKDITKVKENGYLLNHGFDETKPVEELDIEDMKKAAEFRGGKCLSEFMVKGDLYTPLLWECSEGHKFFATPYTVLFAGHWCEDCLKNVWNYDMAASKSPYLAQVYYDSHDRKERKVYFMSGKQAFYREAAI